MSSADIPLASSFFNTDSASAFLDSSAAFFSAATFFASALESSFAATFKADFLLFNCSFSTLMLSDSAAISVSICSLAVVFSATIAAYWHQDRISRRSLRQVFGRCCYGCFVYDGQRSCTGSSRSAGIGRNQEALGAIYQPAARLRVSLQRPAERKNVIYQTRCQEPYGASGTFFVDFL